jgi:Papain family cysteine protease
MRTMLTSLILVISAFAQSQAVQSIAYGPQEFAAAPAVQVAQFAIPPLVDGPFSLYVLSGHLVGATIRVNGTTLVSPSRPGYALVPMPVALDPVNPNTVEIAPAGTPISIAITGYSYAFAADYGLATPGAAPLLREAMEDFTPGRTRLPHDQDVDWRAKGAVTPVKNEGTCLDDWAFSAVGAVEGGVQGNTGHLYSLSEQQLLDCTPPASSCSDASPARALRYLLAASQAGGGADSESSYPYTARIGKCETGITPTVQIDSVTTSMPGEQALLSALERGPVSVVVNGNWFSTYPRTGDTPYTPPSCGTAPPEYRAMLVVGYSSSPAPGYFIVKNSLGTAWGNNGYAYLAHGRNVCGIGNYLVAAH